ncbi:hypothetical protein [Frigoriglobus tundricola]|uniref:Uncharacterized protein n=1 Tax=Frigoriglobus tundricola TaxID=2774151 RepID=A0A6M5YSI8_9BACT|nr:hypothetical protein [Frigoriglobus tundricola]QJW96251.1 hypothetical protein FTUN_3808 [Frigoriglobus tundricola]
MLRSLVLVALSGTVVVAQPAKDAPPGAPPPAVPTVEVRTLTLVPAAAPVPALRYELLPRLRDRVAGNAALDYHRAYVLRPSWPRDPNDAKKLDESLAAWEESAVDRLPVAEVKKYLAGHSQSLRTLDAAAKADRCDWGLNGRLSVSNIDLLLPEAQTFRELARVQKLRVRVDLAENDFDAAVRNLQAGFRLGKDVGEGPTLIMSLVGVAITSIFLGEVEQLVQRPNGPNMYWALTTLPRPLIDPRPALEGETRLFDNMFPNAKVLEKRPVSAERANVILDEMITAFNTMGKLDDLNVGSVSLGGIGVAGYVALQAPAARKQLVALGWAAETVEKMPPAQAVALRTITAYRSFTDDQTKCFSLPYPAARAELGKLSERAEKLKKESGDAIIAMFSLTLPAVEKLYEAHARTARRVAALRALEAIRLHAAANNGQLPPTLADVKVVPVPEDPYTLKPFEYAPTGNTFTLSGPPPAGDKPSRSNNFRYEVTVKEK